MPYFQRVSYAETIADAGSSNPLQPGKKASEPAVLDLANSVLLEETELGDAASGPFRVVQPAKPGMLAKMVLNLAADSDDDPADINLVPTDMRGPDGHRITADCIAPRPKAFTVEPGSSVDLQIAIHVPSRAVAGLYTGRITSVGAERLSIAIEIEVTT